MATYNEILLEQSIKNAKAAIEAHKSVSRNKKPEPKTIQQDQKVEPAQTVE